VNLYITWKGHVTIVVTGSSFGDFTIDGGGGSTGQLTQPIPHFGQKIPSGTLWPVNSPYKDPDSEAFALLVAFEMLNQVPYHVAGPNSNTYAKQLLNLAGFTVPETYIKVPGEPRLGLAGEIPTYKTIRVGPTTTIGWNDPAYGGIYYDANGNKRP
jgi:hypothetical protein